MNFNDTYFAITGLAYTKGLDSFDAVMPRERVLRLFDACYETKSFKWMESSFIDWILCVAGRELRKIGALEPLPKCADNCKYRMPYASPGLQCNALRVEIFSPADRCGWRLKDGRIGGRPDDYYPCTYRGAS